MLRRILLTTLVTASLVFRIASPILAEDPAPPISVQQIVVRVDGASCPFCAFGLEKRLGRIEGVASITIDMKAGKAILNLKPGSRVSEQAIRQAVEEAGFTPREITFHSDAGNG